MVCFGLLSQKYEWFALGYCLKRMNGLLWVTVSNVRMVCFGLLSQMYEWFALGYCLKHMNGLLWVTVSNV